MGVSGQDGSSLLTKGYAAEPSKNARCVAGWAAKKDASDEVRAIKRAPNAIAEMDILHPSLWAAWRQARPKVMDACLKGLRAEEIEKLKTAFDPRQQTIVETFAMDPSQLEVLRAHGVDMDAARQAEFFGQRIDVAVKLAHSGWAGPLRGMSKSGLAGPPEITAAEGDALDKPGKPRCALHLLAASTRWDAQHGLLEPGEAMATMEWLCSASNQRLRNGWGQDALAVAVDAGHGNTARMLCSMGFDPRRKDAKGRDCFDLLERRVKALRIHGPGDKIRDLEKLVPAMLAASERLDLAAAADLERPSEAPKRRASL